MLVAHNSIAKLLKQYRREVNLCGWRAPRAMIVHAGIIAQQPRFAFISGTFLAIL